LQKGANGDDMVEAISSINNGVVNRRKETLLHIAAKNGYMEFTKFLVKEKADVNAVDEDGRTPLYLAAVEGKLDIVKYFVENKILDISIKDIDERVLVSLAIAHSHLEIAQYLINKDTDLNIIGVDGSSPAYAYLNTMKYLIKNRASFDVVNIITLLNLAARRGGLPLVKNSLSKQENADFEYGF